MIANLRNDLRIVDRPALARMGDRVRPAAPADDDLTDPLTAHSMAVVAGDRCVGVGGLEIQAGTALRRSLALDSPRRGTGVGGRLVDVPERHACSPGRSGPHPLTDRFEPSIHRLGHVRVPCDGAPPEVRTARPFSALCPSTAVLMREPLPSLTTGRPS